MCLESEVLVGGRDEGASEALFLYAKALSHPHSIRTLFRAQCTGEQSVRLCQEVPHRLCRLCRPMRGP